MNRTLRHLLYGLAWFLAFVVVFFIVASSCEYSSVGQNQFRSQVGSLIWVVGFAAIFFSWARLDAPEHGKSRRAAVVFAVLWLFLVFIAHAVYLLYTRGLRGGVVAVLKFACFLLASGILVAILGKLVNLFLR